MRKFFIIFCSLLFVFCLLTTSIIAAPDPETAALQKQITEKNNRIKQIEETIAAYKKQIAQTQTQAVSLKNQLSFLDNRVDAVALNVEETNEKISVVTLELSLLKQDISALEKRIARSKVLLAHLLRALQYENNTPLLTVLASHNSLSDFTANVEQLFTLEQTIHNYSVELAADKLDLDAKNIATLAKKQSFENLQLTLKDQEQDLREEAGVKQDLLKKTKASESQFRTIVDNLKAQYQATQNEIAAADKELRRRLEAKNSFSGAETIKEGTLSWPTQSRYVTAYFHDKSYPFRNIFEHPAIDIRNAQGTPVRAAASGYVSKARRCSVGSCYAYVSIVHAGNISTVYGHLSAISVNDDQFVARGDVIGYSGATPGTPGAGPFTTGPHLHFEVRKNGIPVDPLGFLSQ